MMLLDLNNRLFIIFLALSTWILPCFGLTQAQLDALTVIDAKPMAGYAIGFPTDVVMAGWSMFETPTGMAIRVKFSATPTDLDAVKNEYFIYQKEAPLLYQLAVDLLGRSGVQLLHTVGTAKYVAIVYLTRFYLDNSSKKRITGVGSIELYHAYTP